MCWWSGPSLAFSLAPHQSPAPSSDVFSTHHHMVLRRLASPHGSLSIFHHFLSPNLYPASSPRQVLVPLGTTNLFLPVSVTVLDHGYDICCDAARIRSSWVCDPSATALGAWRARAVLGVRSFQPRQWLGHVSECLLKYTGQVLARVVDSPTPA